MSSVRVEPVLIGPVLVGKSTVAGLVAEAVGVPHIDLDTVAEQRYYAESGIDLARYADLQKTEGPLAALRYGEQSFPFVVERALADHTDCVFSFGAGHSCLLDSDLQPQVDAALQPFANVFLLLPSPDVDRSVEILRDRTGGRYPHRWILDGFDCIRYWVTNPANAALSRATVYTDERTAEDVAAEVVATLQSS